MSIVYCYEHDDLVNTDNPVECEDCNRTECPYYLPDINEQKPNVMVDIESEFVRGMVETIGELKELKAEMLETLERLVLAFDVGDMKHTTLNGRGYVALDESRKVIAKAKE